MLLQTNSYIVPKERRAEHSRLIRRFRQALANIGCDQFDVYEQIGANWNPSGANGRYVQLMRFRDQQHQREVQEAERQDTAAQAIIAEFCALINFPYQQQHGYFATGFYTSVLPVGPRSADEPGAEEADEADEKISTISDVHATEAAWTESVEPEEHADLADPAAFGETAIGDTLAPTSVPLDPIVSSETRLLEAPKESADELAAFGLSEEEPANAPVSRPPESIPVEGASDVELIAEAPAPPEAAGATHAEPVPSDFYDDSELLDLSAVELTDDEVADHASSGSTSEPATNRIMLDATLPEEDEFGELLDDTNMRDHAPVGGNCHHATQAHNGHDTDNSHASDKPEETDADLLEFDAFLRQYKEGVAEQGHR